MEQHSLRTDPSTSHIAQLLKSLSLVHVFIYRLRTLDKHQHNSSSTTFSVTPSLTSANYSRSLTHPPLPTVRALAPPSSATSSCLDPRSLSHSTRDQLTLSTQHLTSTPKLSKPTAVAVSARYNLALRSLYHTAAVAPLEATIFLPKRATVPSHVLPLACLHCPLPHLSFPPFPHSPHSTTTNFTK